MYLGQAPASQLQFARPRVPQRFVKDDSRWAGFRPKLAKWLCLCDNYPYRMSFLVLVITDRVQKALVNRLRLTHPSRGDEYGLVHYCKGGEKASTSAPAEAEEPHAGLELADGMPIVEAYFQHVERYIYSHPKARKMLSLDGDPVCAGGVREECHTSALSARGFSQPPYDDCLVYLRRRYLPRCSCSQWRI